jgi:hypothetical protein
MIVYRGTQHRSVEGALKSLSFTDSLPVAVIWSAMPGDEWANRPTKFLESSTVHAYDIHPRSTLALGGDEPGMSLGDLLRTLGYPNGISPEETRKIFIYLHKRLLGRTKGGGLFNYLYVDEEGNEYTDDDLSFSLTDPETMLSKALWDWDGEFEDEAIVNVADKLYIDTFAFADTPAVQRAAIKLGYDSIAYVDAFVGGTDASKVLFGVPVKDLVGVRMEWDFVAGNRKIPTHLTLRVLDERIIKQRWSFPTKEVLASPWSVRAA